MTISVVIPTYRRPAMLLRCLNALFEQDFRRMGGTVGFEIIAVDDGNDPETQARVMQVVPPRHVSIRYLGQPVRSGPAAARNRGWQAARADFIAFTDDDCIPDRDWLQQGLLALQGGAQVVTGQMRVPLPGTPTDYERTTAFLETAEFVTANCFCRRSALERVGGLEESFDIAWREDSDLQFKFLRHGIAIVKRPEAIILHPVRPAAWWACLKDERKNSYDALLYKRHPKLFRERIPSYAGLVLLYYAFVLSFTGLLIAFTAGWPRLATGMAILWLLLLAVLVAKRLSGTSMSVAHIGQVLVTSLVTPFLSVYWRLYGAVKHRVLYV
jgi:glycosyltransferase involved in cell wall biosynthesis